MGCAEWVVFALGALGEARQPAALTQCANAVAPARENFMGVALVADIPNNFVGRRVEHVMQRYGQLDYAQSRTKVAAGFCDCVDGFGAQFVGELLELFSR